MTRTKKPVMAWAIQCTKRDLRSFNEKGDLCQIFFYKIPQKDVLEAWGAGYRCIPVTITPCAKAGKGRKG